MLQQTQQEVVPFWQMSPGVFLVRKPSTKIPLADHYGVLVTGDSLMEFGLPSYDPLIIHRTPDMKAEFAETTGVWEVLDQVPPEQTPYAAARALEEFAQPIWRPLDSNCEHTARYITHGEKKSTQVETVITVSLVSLLILLVARSDN
ncbi:MAG: hypothetical protein ACXWID_07895 [Pyrinomonadaceae bacterium]